MNPTSLLFQILFLITLFIFSVIFTQKIQKKFILAFIYLSRAVVISVFLLVPLSPASVYVFSAVMGLLWLSTVPPTNAAVALQGCEALKCIAMKGNNFMILRFGVQTRSSQHRELEKLFTLPFFAISLVAPT